jgi:hypothetical protein
MPCDRAVRFGVMAALDDSPRPGREPTITDGARVWVVSLAYQKPNEVDIRTSFGQRGCWRVTSERTPRRPDMPA